MDDVWDLSPGAVPPALHPTQTSEIDSSVLDFVDSIDIDRPSILEAPRLQVQQKLCALCNSRSYVSLLNPADGCHQQSAAGSILSAWKNVPHCESCRLIIHVLFDDPDHDVPILLAAHASAEDVSYRMRQFKFGSVRGREVCRLWIQIWVDGKPLPGSMGDKFGLQMRGADGGVSGGEFGEEVLKGRRVCRSQLEMGLVKRWIEYCGSVHSGNCRSLATESKTSTTLRVIDVKERCIVDTPERCRYMALSYVWGSQKGIQSLRLLRANREVLYRSGGLREDDVPTTIADAMELVRRLGAQYLWVDALCIIQDDLDDCRAQIGAMDAVYQGAALTIVAAAGDDANAGLPGVRAMSRWLRQATGTVQGLDMINIARPYFKALLGATWSTRGWTFQEKILSRKRLVFSDYQVFYQCDNATWCEDTTLETDDPETYSTHHEDPRLPAAMSTFGRYANSAEEYSRRNLSFEKDALDAFTGVMNTLKNELGDFLFGLPMNSFDTALLWHFQFGRVPTRRLYSALPGGGEIKLNFPSWSWAGWKNEINYQRTKMPLETCTQPKLKFYRWDNENISSISTQLSTTFQKDDISQITESMNNHRKTLLAKEIQTVLYFYTNSANLEVSREPMDGQDEAFNPKFYNILTASGSDAGLVPLEDSWRKEQPEKLEFIMLSKDFSDPEEGEQLNLMLIVWHCETAYRVQIAKVREDVWTEAGPVPRFIALG